MNKTLLLTMLGTIALNACQPAVQPASSATQFPAANIAPANPPTPTFTTTPQPRLETVAYGPELEDFPGGVSPLTGRPVQDASLLDLPAVLVSISNMPVTARPQAGVDFAAWIFEIFIGEGTTRFMGVFYGDYPRIIPYVTGGCPLRTEILHPSGSWIGNRVWLDENANGQQDAWEVGVGGVCVNLYGENGELLQATSTDSNGYYGLEAPPSKPVFIEFVRPKAYQFTTPNLGDEDRDSDADPDSGRTAILTANSADPAWDAGLILLETPTPTPSPVVTGTPAGFYIPDGPYVGPIRSGRLTYNHIGDMFPNSCLVYASAGKGIREALHGCEIIFGADIYDPNSALLSVKHMRELAERNLNPKQPVNYSGNLFSDLPPQGGEEAESIWVFYHSYSQTLWQYDPISAAYLRQTDNADGAGSFRPATDRLSGRQQSFENVIILYADYQVVRYLQYDVDLSLGQKGKAYLFRDGRVYPMYWSTRSREYEKRSGLLRPIYFLDAKGNPIPLKPGRTWIHVMTEASYLEGQADAAWKATFVQPYDPRK